MFKVIVFCIVLFSSFFACSQDSLILSGMIQAKDNQAFFSPKTRNWRVQIQWMMEEGQHAKVGDLIVVFDGSSIQSQVEQDELDIEAAIDELQRLTDKGKQSVLEAQYKLKGAQLEVDLARIDASIPKVNLSEYDYQKNQLEFEKKLVAREKAKEELDVATIADKVATSKQKLKLEKSQDSFQYNTQKLEEMSHYAEREGPILYGTHPWTGEKVFVGMTAQPSWKIAEIPSFNGLYVEAWVHEADLAKVAIGSTAKLTLDAYPEETVQATLEQIATQPEERKEWGTDAYFKCTFTFDLSLSATLLPGMGAQLELENQGE